MDSINDIFKTATLRQSFVTISGTIINAILGFLFYSVVARNLGPADFGILTLSITTLTLIADLVDLGTNTGLVKHVSSELKNNKEKAYKFLKLGFLLKIGVWILVLIVGNFFAPFIASTFFNKPDIEFPLRLVFIGVGGALLFSFATSALQAYEKFTSWSVINILSNGLRLGLILLLIIFGQLNLLNGLSVYILLPFFGFFMASLLIPTVSFIKTKNEMGVSREFFTYNIWIAAFISIAAISSRLDTFLTGRFLNAYELGIYGVATQLSSIVVQIDSAIGVVASPKFASFTSNKDMLVYFRKLFILVGALAILGLLAIPISYYFIPLIFGEAYISSIPIFHVLLIAMLVFLISLPIHNSIIYYFAKPQVFVWVSFGHLLIIGILGYFLIQSYGLMGAAVSVLVGTIWNLVAPGIWLLIKIRK